MHLHPSRFRVLLLLLTLLFVLSSCNGPSAPSTESITLTDALGRSVTLPGRPQRVAALIGSFADLWLLAGGSLCAAAEDAWEDFGLTLEDTVNIGGAHSPSLELLVASDPELVLASASTASHVELEEALTSMGIPVVYFDVDHFEDYLAMLKTCTDLTGRSDLYEINGLALRANIEAIKQDFQNAALPESRRKILLLRTSSSSVKAKGSRGTILGEMLADMGCINIADSDSTLLENLSLEAILRADPHHVFVVTMGSDTEKAMASLELMISENPAWQGLAAIRENRLHLMDKTLFNMKPNVRWAEAYQILYETLIQE
ncbi:MAG: ABC transporter substrate-binding protein [Clostridia bacterium]|nr:ABC transporter substrate-binding protein [Clostridia bacterium]